MRRSVVALIAARETRDLLRDRRTVLLILVMPAVLYPFFGLVGVLFALSLKGQTTTVGVFGAAHLPAADGPYPPLLANGTFAKADPAAKDEPKTRDDLGPLVVVERDDDPEDALRSRAVDVAVVVPPGFAAELAAGRKPTLKVLDRDGDEKSKMAADRVTARLSAWRARVKEAKFVKAGLPKDYDVVFTLDDPQERKPKEKKTADVLRDQFVKVFPFILMMWLIAGAIQPAVDLTAGEKERGTMETLLISPAERTEIVAGKFLATTTFAFASVVWNVLWVAGGVLVLESLLGFPVVYLPGLLGCVVLGIPLAMFFSAVCLALGVFARSTKEGQYYLMPLILVAMPLAFWSMKPGAELTAGNALVPVTGALLLQQKLLAVTGDPTPWGMFAPVLGGLAAAVALALWLAVRQFNNETVLFRETGAEKGGGLLGRVFRRR